MSVMKGNTDTEYAVYEDKDYDYFVIFVALLIAFRFWVSIY